MQLPIQGATFDVAVRLVTEGHKTVKRTTGREHIETKPVPEDFVHA